MTEGELVKSALTIALCLMLFVMLRSLRRLSSNRSSRFNFEDLLLGADGRASKAALVMWGAFILSTWVILYLTLRNRLTEGYMGLYMASWVAPQLTGILKGKSAQPEEPKP